MTAERPATMGSNLDIQLAAAGLQLLDAPTKAKFELYLDLILRWNSKMNLTAIRDADGIIRRHFVESIACAQALPVGIATVLDFGSGAGFPGIPIAICRPEIRMTLGESQNKKAAFLREVVRSLELDARVVAGRAEDLKEQFDCVTLRAVDRMGRAVAAASNLVKPGGLLATFTTEADRSIVENAGDVLGNSTTIPIYGSEQRILVLSTKG
jgi:16S rRNA (guanine527-N7)-methyltransferase